MKIKLLFIVCILLLGSLTAFGQVRIQMQKEGGVYKIPCIVNGLRLKFIFDTGASVVSISLSEANLMLDNGYLDKSDIIGTGKAQIADGSIVNNTRIILREIKIDDLILKNVEAVVINEQKAPLLLGQSAIEKLGKIQIDGDELIIMNANSNGYSEVEIETLVEQASAYYSDKMYVAAASIYQKLFNQNVLTIYGVMDLANSYKFAGNYTQAIKYYLKIKDEMLVDSINAKYDSSMIFFVFFNLGDCYLSLKEYSESELYIQKSKLFANNDRLKNLFYGLLMHLYILTENCNKIMQYVYLSLEYQAKYVGVQYEDILSGKTKSEDLGWHMHFFAERLIEDCGEKNEGVKLMISSARNGNVDAIVYCKNNNVIY